MYSYVSSSFSQEEAGLEAEQMTVWKEISHRHGYRRYGHPFTVTFFLARMNNYDQEIKLSKEHQDHKWCRYEDAVHTMWFPSMERMLRRMRDKLPEALGIPSYFLPKNKITID